MRIVESCLVLVVIVPDMSSAGNTPPAPVPPPPTVTHAPKIKLKTGGANLLLTDEEKEREMLQRTAAVGPDTAARLFSQAQLGQVQMLINIMPQWAHLIPLPVIMHVNFKEDDDDLTRAKKYVRLALLVRDMYEDFPLMHALGTFPINTNNRLSDTERHALAGEAFAQAALILQDLQIELSGADLVDYWLSLAQVEYWSLYQMVMVPERLSEALALAQHALADANRAQRAMTAQNNELEGRIQDVRTFAQRFIASVIAPALYLAMIQVQTSKKGW